MSIRPVKRVIRSKPTLEGAGVHLRRAFGFGHTSDFDPFLLLDVLMAAGEGAILAGPVWATPRKVDGGEWTGQGWSGAANQAGLGGIGRFAVDLFPGEIGHTGSRRTEGLEETNWFQKESVVEHTARQRRARENP
jgi:hypothetical protein